MDAFLVVLFVVFCFVVFPGIVIGLSIAIDRIEQEIRSRKEDREDENMD